MREPISRHAFELVALAIAAAIAAHAPHLPIWLCIAAPAALIARVALRRRGGGPAPLAIRLPLSLLLLIAVVLHYGTLFGREPGSALGCGLLALKLLETERARDARVAIGFAGFVLMSALLFMQSLVFTACVSLILILLFAALVSLQPAPVDTRRRLRNELRVGAILFACGLPLAAAGFVLVPRLSTPLWGGKDRQSDSRTGLSESMEPGSLTELLIDDSPAFRVRFDAAPPLPQQRYFRAIVLSEFDGATWTRGRQADFARSEDAERDGPPVDYAITLEPTDRRWLPTLDLPFVAPGGSRFTADRELIADDIVAQPREYRVRSSSRYTFARSLSAQERARALALPDGFDPRTRALAADWRAANDDVGVVRAALDLFHASFHYTLNPPLLGRNSIDDFLFSTQRGFCEHYASAFVVLMRSAGIPARVVTGYQGGWWNDSGGYLLVRNSDAHAWAEVWMAGRGWMRVDPTAAVSPERIELGAAAANDVESWTQSSWVRDIRNRFDRVSGWWTQAIIRFDALRQRGLLTPFGVVSANQGDLLVALSLVLAVVLLLATVWAMREAKPPRGDDALDAAWTSLRRRLERAGVEPRPSEGPLDFLVRARAELPKSAAALNGLVGDYVALRYGVDEPVPERVRFFTRAVRNFRIPRRVKKGKPGAALQR